MVIDTAPATIGTQLRYARVSTGHYSLDQQVEALTAEGVDTARIYSDTLSGTSTREQRPGLAARLDYAREGDAFVVVGIDRLGRSAAEVMAGVLASLAELEFELVGNVVQRLGTRGVHAARHRSTEGARPVENGSIAEDAR